MDSQEPVELAALDQRISELLAEVRSDQREFADAAAEMGGREPAAVVMAFTTSKRVADILEAEGITDDPEGARSARLAMLYAVAIAKLQELDPAHLDL